MALRKFANDIARIDDALDKFLEGTEPRQVFATAFLIRALDGHLDTRCYHKLERAVEKNTNLFASDDELEICNKLLLGALLAPDRAKFTGDFLQLINFAKYVYNRVDGSGASFYTKVLSARLFSELQTEQFYDILSPVPVTLQRKPTDISEFCYAEMLFGASVTIENVDELLSVADINLTLPKGTGTGDELSDLAFFALRKLFDGRVSVGSAVPPPLRLGFNTFPPVTPRTKSWALIAFSRSDSVPARKLKTMGVLADLEPAPRNISRGMGTLVECKKFSADATTAAVPTSFNLNGAVERSPGQVVPFTMRWYENDPSLYLYTGLFSESYDFALRVPRKDAKLKSGKFESRKLAGGAVSIRITQTFADGFELLRSALVGRGGEVFVFTALVPPAEQSSSRPRQQANVYLPPRLGAKTWPVPADEPYTITMDRMPVSNEKFVGMIDFFTVYCGPRKSFECRKGRDRVTFGHFTVRMSDFAILRF